MRDLVYEPTLDYARRRGVPLRLIRDAALVELAEPDAIPPLEIPEVRPARHEIPESWWGRPMTTQPIYTVELQNALCFGGPMGRRGVSGPDVHAGGQLLVTEDGVLIDDSFHVRHTARTVAESLVAREGDAYRLLSDPADAATRAGLHVLLGGTFPGQFGHFLIEGLSRTWFPREAATYVVYEPELRPWQRVLLRALGIHDVFHVIEPTRFERLIVPSRAFNLHSWIAPEMTSSWGRIRDAFEPGRHERVYLSRSRFTKRRTLVNESEVEDAFGAHGFVVVHPQEGTIAEQVGVAAGARVLAGSAGSNMYLGMFQAAGGQRMIVSPRRFTPLDDVLISHAAGTDLSYVLCEPVTSERQDARHADYVADMRFVHAQLRSLESQA